MSLKVQQTQGVSSAAPKGRRLRVPADADGIQVNHCRMPSCVNFGVPARTSPIKKGRVKGSRVPQNLPDATAASCRNTNCANHGQTVAARPDAYSRYGKTLRGTQRYGCKACKSTFSVAQAGPSQAAAVSPPQDVYQVVGNRKFTPALRCSGCGERVPIKSNAGIAEELNRLAAPLRSDTSRTHPSCPNVGCENYGKTVSRHRDLYHRHGAARSSSDRWRCTGCLRTFSVPIVAPRRHRRLLDNELILQLLMNKMPLRRE